MIRFACSSCGRKLHGKREKSEKGTRATIACPNTLTYPLFSQMLVPYHIAWLTILVFASPLSAQKVGDSLLVVAESEAELKTDSGPVGTVPRGELVTVGEVGNGRFWVMYGNTSGWIAKQVVLSIDEAIRYFTKAIANEPRADDYFGRGNAWCDKNQYDKAIADCSEAIRLEPKFYEAFSLRGYAYALKGNATEHADLWSKAIADYTKAIGLNPNGSGTWYNRGYAYSKAGDFDKAIADCTEAIRLDPKDPKSYLWRARAHSAKGDFDLAIADYNEAILRNSKRVEAYFHRQS